MKSCGSDGRDRVGARATVAPSHPVACFDPAMAAMAMHSTRKRPARTRAAWNTSCVSTMRGIGRDEVLGLRMLRAASRLPAGSAPARAGRPRPACSIRRRVPGFAIREGPARFGGADTKRAPREHRCPPLAPTGSAHRREQHAEEKAVESVSARPVRASRSAAVRGAKQRIGERRAIDEHAHEHIERQRLEEVVLEQAHDSRGNGGEDRSIEGPDGDSRRGEGQRDTHESRIHAGSPVATIATATAASIQSPQLSTRTARGAR